MMSPSSQVSDVRDVADGALEFGYPLQPWHIIHERSVFLTAVTEAARRHGFWPVAEHLCLISDPMARSTMLAIWTVKPARMEKPRYIPLHGFPAPPDLLPPEALPRIDYLLEAMRPRHVHMEEMAATFRERRYLKHRGQRRTREEKDWLVRFLNRRGDFDAARELEGGQLPFASEEEVPDPGLADAITSIAKLRDRVISIPAQPPNRP